MSIVGRATRVALSRRAVRVVSTASAVLIATLLAAPAAFASPPPATITIIDGDTGFQTIVDGEPEVCSFAIVVDFDVTEAIPEVGWSIKDWASTWQNGTTRMSGSGSTDADGVIRIPASGFATLPDGRYNVIVDDESPVDSSSIRQSFHVTCPVEPTPTPTATPTPTPTATPTATPTTMPTATPTATPTGSVEPTSSVAPTPTPTVEPTGSVAPTATPTPSIEPTGTPTAGPTLPPTDAASGGPGGTGWNVGLAVTGLLVFAAAAFATRPRQAGGRHD